MTNRNCFPQFRFLCSSKSIEVNCLKTEINEKIYAYNKCSEGSFNCFIDGSIDCGRLKEILIW